MTTTVAPVTSLRPLPSVRCNTDYLEFFVTSVAEFPGIFVTLFLSDLIGRKLTMTSEFFGSAVFYFL